MKKERDFANTANSAVIAISENSKLFYKCEAMLLDVVQCIQDMGDKDELRGFDFLDFTVTTTDKIFEALKEVQDLHESYSYEIQHRTDMKFI